MDRQRKVLYEFHEFRFDPQKRLLLRDRKVVPLTVKVSDILLLLLQNGTRVVTIEELRKEVWNGIVTTPNNINVHVSKIRKILGQSRYGHQCIKTIGSQGYLFDCEVRRIWDEARDPPFEQQAPASVTAEKNVAPERVPPQTDPAIAAEPSDAAKTSDVRVDDRISGSAASTGRRLIDTVGNHKRIIRAVVLILLAAVIFYLILHGSKQLPPLRVSHAFPITNDGHAKTNPIVTDGLRLYFSELVDGNKLLFQMVNTGGEMEKIPVPFANSVLVDISPDHTELLLGNEATIETEMRLWVMKVSGGSPRPLGDLRGHAGAWSPDRRHIVYANGSTLYLANNDGSGSRELVNVYSGLPYNLRWSPDGKLLRFEVRDLRNRSTSLWEMEANETGVRPLLPGWGNPPAECCGDWTPDGKYFLFQATRNQMTNIWAISEKAGMLGRASREPIQLTDGPMSFRSPVLSKDGNQLFAIGEQRLGEIVRYDAMTQQWVRYLPGISADYLDYSSDGERITYVTYPEGNLWICRADGSDRRQISFPPMRAYGTQWSPDGRQVAFTATSTEKQKMKIYLVSPDGGSSEQIISGDENEYGPAWAPDGSTLAFWSGERALGTSAIYLFSLRTQEVSMLPGSEGLFAPRWSPRGGFITAISGNAESVMLYDLNQQNWTHLVRIQKSNESVRINIGSTKWSRDGNYVYFRSLYQDDPAVYRVRIKDAKLERWATLKDLRQASGVFGPWMGLGPDDSVLVLRDIGIQNIYAFDLHSP
ncbi:MAG TPA: winged helix-turn-helix domain-containing protein [Blastocatellia bacterium]|nr:winged helix-turn-helix domain-containing protein [Blastocatellia bacterium]